jgi:multimeric flavodoxin WrbA
MTVIGINGSPRKGWNTSLMVQEALKGAASNGAETELVNLYDLDFKGCVSCFGCKLDASRGRCVQKDGLKPVLDSIHECDGLVIGSPIYIGDVTANIRALIERLIFQYISYRTEEPNYFKRRIPVLLIYTTNCPEAMYDKVGYTAKFNEYEQMFSNFIGPAKTVYASETMQVKDYEKYAWSQFDVTDRRKLREDVFPQDLKKAFDMAAEMFVCS